MKPRNPWSASLKVGSMRVMARFRVDARTSSLEPCMPASVEITSSSNGGDSTGASSSTSAAREALGALLAAMLASTPSRLS